jgi:hypothetical protein
MITFPLEIYLQHIVVISPDSRVNVSAIYVYSRLLGDFLDMFFISLPRQPFPEVGNAVPSRYQTIPAQTKTKGLVTKC